MTDRKYSANEELEILFKNLGFEVYFFDDPSFENLKLIESSKNCEIDAIATYKNIICIISVDRGKRSNIEKKIEKFFEKLDKINTFHDLKFKIIGKGSEKNKEKMNCLLERITSRIRKLRKDYKIILRKVFFSPNFVVEQEQILKNKQKGEIIIDKEIYDYFIEVLHRLGKEFLFRDFLYFMGIRKVDLKKIGTSKRKKPSMSEPYTVSRMEIEVGRTGKPKIVMYSFSVRVEDIIEYVTVLRIAQKYDKRGFQRMVKPGRLEKISKEYLSKNETFPNNIIIALNPEIYKDETEFYSPKNDSFGELRLFQEFNSLIIIDGQHRLFSFIRGKKPDRKILVTLLFFNFKDVEKSYLTMYRLFYEINKKQERIDPNISFFLKAKIDPTSPESFWYDVFIRLHKEKGFFKDRFSFKETTLRRREKKKSIVSVIQYGGVLTLNKTIRRNNLKIDGLEIFYTGKKNEDERFAFNLIKNYFDIIEAVLHNQKVEKDKINPREIGALLRLIRHFMINDKDKIKTLGKVSDILKKEKQRSKEIKKVVSYVKKILNCIPFSEVIQLEYGASNWAAIEGFMLKKIHEKGFTSFGSKLILSKKGREIYETNI